MAAGNKRTNLQTGVARRHSLDRKVSPVHVYNLASGVSGYQCLSHNPMYMSNTVRNGATFL